MRIKKSLVVFLAILMLFSNAALAGAAGNLKQLHEKNDPVNHKLAKKFNPETGEDYKATDKVRVIVELEKDAGIQIAQKKNTKYSDLSSSEKKSIHKTSLEAQKKVKNLIADKSIPMEYNESFTTVMNGFSGVVNYKSVKVIEGLSEVKEVYIVNKYERPETEPTNAEPDMIYSKDMVNAPEAWEEFQYKGEGMVVAVIDTGIDPTHRDMVLTDSTTGKLTEEDVDAAIDGDLDGKYFTPKVPFGYNYADHNYEVRDLGPEASMHGMHVSGTVGANGDEENGGIKGVAPEAQILGMKVFGNDPLMPYTFGDIYIKAIDDAIALGADAINMSLGSTAAFVDSEDPEQQAVARAVNNGVVMAISAGNSANFGNGFGNPLPSNPDIGVVGAPGLSYESLQVASMENQYLDLDAFSYSVDGEEAGATTFLSASSVHPDDLEVKTYDVVYAGLGRMPGDEGSSEPETNDFEGLDLDGKIALIQRGETPFVTKALNAQNAGAAGVIIFNHSSGYVSMATSSDITIPQLFILKDAGEALKEEIEAGKDVSLTFTGEKMTALNPDAGKLSSFTSWGLTPNLDFKPEISAPGGNILSTFNDNQYGLMSGTSMAAPHVAGGSALMLQRVDADFGVTGPERVNLAKNILMNTASVQADKGLYNSAYPTDNYFSPRRGGAGLMDLEAALKTPVIVTHEGEAKVSLKEIGEETTFTLKAENVSDERVTYELLGNVQTDLVLGGENLLEAQGIYEEGTVNADAPWKGEYPIDFTSDDLVIVDGKKYVSIPANSSVEFDVTVDLSNAVDWAYNAPLDEIFENGYFVEGFVQLKDANDLLPELSIPYVGFKGDWDQAPILDGMKHEESSFYGEAGMASALDGDYEYLGENPADGLVHDGKIAISPNGDGVRDDIVPYLTFLRNAKEVKYSILNEDEESLRTLATENNVRKHYYDGSEDLGSLKDSAVWDGKVKRETVEDGVYYYEIQSVIDYGDAEWQSVKVPVYVDTQAPEITATLDAGSKKLSWNATDEGVGISHFDVVVNNQSVLETPLAADVAEYTLTDIPADASVKVVAYDYAGNTETDAVVGEDNKVPSIFVPTPEALVHLNTNTVPVEGYVEDASGMEELLVNGKTVPLTYKDGDYHFKTTVEFENDGVHHIDIEGTDDAGNEIGFRRTVMTDTTVPTLEVDAPESVDESTDKTNLNVKVGDNYSHAVLKLDGSEIYKKDIGESLKMEAFTHELEAKVMLDEGDNVFELELIDVAGNKTVKEVNIFRGEVEEELTIPNVELPTNHNEPIARLHVRQDVPLLKLNEDGSFTEYKMLKRGEFYRTYGVMGQYYNVGGDYYVKHEEGKMSVYIGRISINKDTKLYAPDGTVHRTLKKGEQIRVYSYNKDQFNVGGGYYVANNADVTYYVGHAKITQDTYLYTPHGTVYKKLLADESYRVYGIDGYKIDLGGGYYVINNKAHVNYSKN
ncbi:S8 family serine peptidase [Pseudalkalibacillus sp. R45]|uniref:S8 family serine peptidase n=1 Tax=Pseudalkalibacillus sp. R45 TaxID=3457433 RepID=UPI003FCCDE46